MTEQIPIVVILGATAVGKTATAIRLAKETDGEVVSVDSRYFYRGMDIGTAKPSLEEMQGVPHHMVDIANPDEVISLGMFQKMAAQVIADIHQRGRLPILVGGTGQYIRAVVEGWTVPEVAPQPEIRTYFLKLWEQEGPEAVQRWLKLLDPQAYQQVDLRNSRRVIRALEVIYSSGRMFSQQRSREPSPYHPLQIGLRLPRETLYQRADARVDWMMAHGFVEEVWALLENGFDENLPSMTAIGYYELCAYLHGKMTVSEAVYKIKMRTHNFIRKQATWFRSSDPAIHWLDMDQDADARVLSLTKLNLEGGAH